MNKTINNIRKNTYIVEIQKDFQETSEKTKPTTIKPFKFKLIKNNSN